MGTDSSTLNTGTLNSTTSFWVRIDSACGSIDSNTATVTTICDPTINSGPSDRSITEGSSTALSVSATNATTYEWFRGTAPDTSDPVGTNSSSFNTGALTTTTSYWVRVSNGCGSVDSSTATVTVTACTPPSIVTPPQDATITTGHTASLSVSVTGTAPFTYKWYEGNFPSTTKLKKTSTASSATNTFVTPVLTASTNYWVEITNACDSARSATVHVTVTSGCTAPAITVQPTGATVQPGEFASLSVTATGTNLQYQWYKGTKPDESNPISGGDTASIGVAPATTTSYWVKITNDCGSASSNTVTVTVATVCVAPAITVQPANVTVNPGDFAPLAVTATGTDLQYQWYAGAKGDESHPLSSGTIPSIGVAPSVTTTYWVKVSNDCGSVNSEAATVTVTGTCPKPAITIQPVGTTIGPSERTTIFVGATGTGLKYQWYEGASGDTSHLLRGATTFELLTPPRGHTSSFFVRVTNDCGGFIDSDAAVIERTPSTRRHGARRP